MTGTYTTLAVIVTTAVMSTMALTCNLLRVRYSLFGEHTLLLNSVRIKAGAWLIATLLSWYYAASSQPVLDPLTIAVLGVAIADTFTAGSSLLEEQVEHVTQEG